MDVQERTAPGTGLDGPVQARCPAEDVERALNGAPHDDDLALERNLVGGLAELSHAYLRWVDANADHGLTFVRLRLIERLSDEGPAMMRTLADELRLTPRHMTALVDALEDEKLVARRPHPTDRRATIVELTATGCKAANAVLGPCIDAMAELFDELTPDERSQLAGLVRKLLAGLQERGQRA
jgi:DNA-binding MarR family transcriptional regulator